VLIVTHNPTALIIRKVTDAKGSTEEVVLSPSEVIELIRYLNEVQVTGSSLTYIPAPGLAPAP
jgi:hypothetical protein